MDYFYPYNYHMQKYSDNTINPKVAFVEDIKSISSAQDLTSKKLCIIKE